eukprot:scaffold627396_cov17-Prasinocladus_malaysianus.AAC.1
MQNIWRNGMSYAKRLKTPGRLEHQCEGLAKRHDSKQISLFSTHAVTGGVNPPIPLPQHQKFAANTMALAKA